jgi:hypothetical protein
MNHPFRLRHLVVHVDDGASLNGSRPAPWIVRLARGLKAWRSMPAREINRLAAVAMNSIAQHAVPNGIGHNEFARDQF